MSTFLCQMCDTEVPADPQLLSRERVESLAFKIEEDLGPKWLTMCGHRWNERSLRTEAALRQLFEEGYRAGLEAAQARAPKVPE